MVAAIRAETPLRPWKCGRWLSEPPADDDRVRGDGRHTPSRRRESWPFWPFPQELPLGRTDPTIPTTSEGQRVDRQESPGAGGSPIVITNTLTWKLTLEPDAGQ